jgi:hypothetical protein
VRLELSAERREELAPDLAALRTWLAELEAIDLDDWEPILTPLAREEA